MTNQFDFDRKVKPKGMPKKVKVFDTTLRDGEQTPGVTLTPQDKMRIAEALSELGVDVIEAGFPVSSKIEFKAVQDIADAGLASKVCGLARCVDKDMDTAMDANVDLVHIFIGTSPIHRKHKLKMSKAQILDRTEYCIQYVKDRGFAVHFSPEDACRTELPYLTEVCKLASDMKVDHINIPDTVGVMTPAAMRWLISELAKVIKPTIAVHCHNDFGMAVANSVAAIEAGAKMPHVTVNGLGERAGNADLEQTVLAAKLIYGVESNIKYGRIYETSKLVEKLSGVKIMPNFPIVGGNAFAHESGVHVHGVLKKAATYEAIDPDFVGAKRRILVGKLGGKSGVKEKLSQIDFRVTEVQLVDITDKVKNLAAKGKKVTEEDLVAIAEDVAGDGIERTRIIELVDMTLHSKFGEKPAVEVVLSVRGKRKRARADGVGPVDATLNAIREALGDKNISLDEYHLDAITGGSNALADVTIRVSKNGAETMARGVNEDVVMASVIAFINGVNRLLGK